MKNDSIKNNAGKGSTNAGKGSTNAGKGSTNAGKGDLYRKISYTKWSENYDKIFNKKPKEIIKKENK